MKKNFQVNLGGIINLLSNHLYSSSHVFIRELIQNANDAITAVNMLDIKPSIHIELFSDEDGTILSVIDNGSGLTHHEIEQFLSSVGSSIKRDQEIQRNDFIGRFGVGLLSCFMVCDEITLVTKSRKNHEVHKWIGFADGAYTVERLPDATNEYGTQVYIKFKADQVATYSEKKIKLLIREYANYLSYPIFFNNGKTLEQLNDQLFPWESKGAPYELDNTILNASLRHFNSESQHYIDLRIPEIELEGIAYILASNTTRHESSQKIYLKRMWLADSGEKLLPEWAFFLNCFVNSNQLSPTASRESLYINDAFDHAKKLIRERIKDYFRVLSAHDPEKMLAIVNTHYKAFKNLAVEEDDIFDLIINWLKFETSLGDFTLPELVKKFGKIEFTSDYDKYRQIKPLAMAQNSCVVNAAYLHEADLIRKFKSKLPEIEMKLIDTNDFVALFEPISIEERNKLMEFIQLSNQYLKPYDCELVIKRYEPESLPAIFFMSDGSKHLRDMKDSIAQSNALFGAILNKLLNTEQQDPSVLCVNLNNLLIQQLATQQDPKLIDKFIVTIYINALLQGHHPLKQKEMNHLTQSLVDIMQMGISTISNK
jgi:molecular chaperone HtpG